MLTCQLKPCKECAILTDYEQHGELKIEEIEEGGWQELSNLGLF